SEQRSVREMFKGEVDLNDPRMRLPKGAITISVNAQALTRATFEGLSEVVERVENEPPEVDVITDDIERIDSSGQFLLTTKMSGDLKAGATDSLKNMTLIYGPEADGQVNDGERVPAAALIHDTLSDEEMKALLATLPEGVPVMDARTNKLLNPVETENNEVDLEAQKEAKRRLGRIALEKLVLQMEREAAEYQKRQKERSSKSRTYTPPYNSDSSSQKADTPKSNDYEDFLHNDTTGKTRRGGFGYGKPSSSDSFKEPFTYWASADDAAKEQETYDKTGASDKRQQDEKIPESEEVRKHRERMEAKAEAEARAREAAAREAERMKAAAEAKAREEAAAKAEEYVKASQKIAAERMQKANEKADADKAIVDEAAQEKFGRSFNELDDKEVRSLRREAAKKYHTDHEGDGTANRELFEVFEHYTDKDA
ncbi:MAG TPA: hypothetical protein VK502_01335, partial [Candidatus Saccharimonadales bacterium]|nr:hypothetical protein [Candidatus Saccharimonadales bacterium]